MLDVSILLICSAVPYMYCINCMCVCNSIQYVFFILFRFVDSNDLQIYCILIATLCGAKNPPFVLCTLGLRISLLLCLFRSRFVRYNSIQLSITGILGPTCQTYTATRSVFVNVHVCLEYAMEFRWMCSSSKIISQFSRGACFCIVFLTLAMGLASFSPNIACFIFVHYGFPHMN